MDALPQPGHRDTYFDQHRMRLRLADEVAELVGISRGLFEWAHTDDRGRKLTSSMSIDGRLLVGGGSRGRAVQIRLRLQLWEYSVNAQKGRLRESTGPESRTPLWLQISEDVL